MPQVVKTYGIRLFFGWGNGVHVMCGTCAIRSGRNTQKIEHNNIPPLILPVVRLFFSYIKYNK